MAGANMPTNRPNASRIDQADADSTPQAPKPSTNPKRNIRNLPTELRTMIYERLDAFQLLCLSHAHPVFYHDINSPHSHKLLRAAFGYRATQHQGSPSNSPAAASTSPIRTLTVNNIDRVSTALDAKRLNLRFVPRDFYRLFLGKLAACTGCMFVSPRVRIAVRSEFWCVSGCVLDSVYLFGRDGDADFESWEGGKLWRWGK
ncbi:hypothetical protein BJ508DRAFT_156295 [Ascobolus immersus RN42]|uniref:F-box domain-containing protein n=1 Tax=Ascobolus immersus RN42 TaxID=1160509 RepID=A0A3N4HWV1_ASCIM|nr:hypothetical protein BJ508DRAFT_156295 [Ascobolus immersus RN42]